MIRKLKLLGVLAGVLAMFAMTASPAHAQFTSAGYPAAITGTSTADVTDWFGSTFTCTDNKFTASIAEATSTLTVSPHYTKCTMFGLPVTINLTSCDFLFHKGASDTLDIACKNAGDAIDLSIYSSGTHGTLLCHTRIPPQTGLTGYTLTTSDNTIVISGSIGEITVAQTRTNFLCPAGTHTSSGKYTIQAAGITLSGNNGAISVD